MYRKIFFILFNIFVGFLIINIIPANLKVDIRFALFNQITKDISDFELSPLELVASEIGFLHYKQRYIDAMVTSNQIKPLQFSDTMSMIDKVKKITLTYSKNGGNGCGAHSEDLIRNIKWLSEDNGHGCCSDHSQVFVAMCLVNKIFAREVHHKLHTFNEFYDSQREQWIWIDSQYCLMAKDDEGNFLSFTKIHQRFNEGKSIKWYFFGTSAHKLYHVNDIEKDDSNYFTKESFSLLTMTLGNNVFQQNYYNHQYAWLPIELRQFFLISTNKQPSYLSYDPNDLYTSYIVSLTRKIFLSFILWLSINLFILFPSLKHRITKIFL